MLLIDTSLIVLSVFLVNNYLHSESSVGNSNHSISLYFYSILIGLTIYIFTGQYKGLMRYMGINIFYSIFARNFLFIFIVSIISTLDSNKSLSGSQIALLFFLIFNLSIFTRFLIREFFKDFYFKKPKESKNVVIYGAGRSGAKLAASLKEDSNYNILYFVDDSPALWGRSIYGINILSPDSINKRENIDQVHIAIPSLKKNERKLIFERVQSHVNEILELNLNGSNLLKNINKESLQPLNIENLLGREVVPPVADILNRSVFDLVVCVTGAGGSIGSELCRQIIKLNPKKLIIIENNEYSLYKLINSFKEEKVLDVKIIPILGSVTDQNFIRNTYREYGVEILFHAAAYKHVPLVESCPMAGIKNNVLSSYYLCKEAIDFNLKKVILISTDKAVRPSNVMGASKRLSELIFSAFSSISKETVFSLVRFGNVLGSSGSVVPLFQKQIDNREPITLTDPRIIRYFMTISEASQLVLQSSVLAKGGETFLLDMGEPVQIKDLAKQMINLSGLTVKDNNNPSGDIEIKVTGLRPGEKLYEELLIDGDAQPTIHPLIFKSNDSMLSYENLIPKLDLLVAYIKEYNQDQSIKLLKEIVPEWVKSNIFEN